MSRYELIMNEVEECFEYLDINGCDYDYEFSPTTSAENITDLIIKHEQDTLKEFVEWLNVKYKGKFDKQAETYQHFYEDGFSTQDCEYHRGKLNEIEDLVDELNQDLENFIKEKK